MSEWKETKLGDIINLKRGYDLPNSKRTFGRYPIISSSGITDFHDEYMKEPPGVVTGRYGTIGKVFYTEQPYWPLNTTLYVTDFNGNSPKFIFYFLQSFDFTKFSDKSTIPGVNRNHLYTEIVNVPPLKEQTAIASVLSSLDNKIDLLHRQNATLEKMAETLFRQWFVDEVKGEWEKGKVNDLIKILPGYAFRSNTFAESGKYRLITIKSVQDGYLELNNADKIEEVPVQMPNFCKLEIGDILLSLTGNVGRCCLVDTTNLLLNQRVAKLHPINERDRAYTYFLFRQPQFKQLLEEMGKGTAQSNLSPIETSNMELIIPDEEKLIEFSAMATPLLNKLLFNKKSIQTLTDLRDTLLPKLMSGEVKILI